MTTPTALDLDAARRRAAPRVRERGSTTAWARRWPGSRAGIALGTLIRRFPDLALASDTPAWNGRLVLRGLDSLPVALSATVNRPE